ncbi:MAG: hypothetical protein Q4C70_00050 [Planctomycetia bacterium]|nr:hypothetical protein [Planctomycetia bacterium]
MKGKLDADKLKELCINHFEKVIFALLVMFFLSMVLSALKVEPYTKKPEELSSACSRAESKLNEEQEVIPVERNYDSLINGIQEQLPSANYMTTAAWNPILSKEGQKRRAPRALAIQNLQVCEWHGSVQKPQRSAEEMEEEPVFDDGFGGVERSTTEGVRCCILIGELPKLEQETEFANKLGTPLLSDSRTGMYAGMNGQTADGPFYYDYTVERALVPADGDLEKIKEQDWVDLRKRRNKKLSVNESRIRYFNGDSELGGHGGGGADIPDKYQPPQIYRKPKLVATDTADGKKTGRNGRQSVNSNMVPGMEMGVNGMMTNGLVPAKDATLMVPLPQVVQSSNQTQFNWNVYLPYPEEFELDLMVDGQRVRKSKSADDDADGEEDEDAEDGEEDEDYDDEEDDEKLEAIDPTMMGGEMEKAADVSLFRYVDYTVEPGKQYVYRVKVQLHNPNYQYEPAFNLENPDDGKVKYLESDWSNVTLPVSIPLDNHFYLAGFSKFYPRTAADRKDPKIKKWSPYVSLMPVKFNEDNGNEDFTHFDEITVRLEQVKKSSKKKKVVKKEEPMRLAPGQLLNLLVEEDTIRQLGNMSYQTTSYGNRFEDEEEEKDLKQFNTGFILLDVRGGDELYAPIDEKDFEGADEAIKKNPRGIYSPSMVLLIGPKNDFIIQSELEDVADVYRRRDTMEMNQQFMEDMSSTQEEETPRSRRSRRNKDGEVPPEPTRSSSRDRLNR